jgi:hypothetical protein
MNAIDRPVRGQADNREHDHLDELRRRYAEDVAEENRPLRAGVAAIEGKEQHTEAERDR